MAKKTKKNEEATTKLTTKVLCSRTFQGVLLRKKNSSFKTSPEKNVRDSIIKLLSLFIMIFSTYYVNQKLTQIFPMYYKLDIDV